MPKTAKGKKGGASKTKVKVGLKNQHKKKQKFNASSQKKPQKKRIREAPEAEPESVQSKLQRFDDESKRPKKRLKTGHNQQQQQKGGQQPNPEEEEENSEDNLQPEDIEFFEKHGGVMSFVSGVDAVQQEEEERKEGKGRRRKKKQANMNQPEEWEQPRNNAEWNPLPSKNKLPVKSYETGEVVDADDLEDQKSGDEGSEDEDARGDLPVDGQEINEVEIDADLIEAQSFQQRQERIIETKQQIASLAKDILEDPDHKLTRMKTIHNLSFDPEPTIRKVALLSQLAIFVDLLPGYKIRLPTEEELKVRVSKEIESLRKSEGDFLTSYSRYIKALSSIIKNAPKAEISSNAPKNTVTAIAVRCFCELLHKAAHFNFRSNIQFVLMPLSNCNNPQIAKSVQEATIILFKDELNGVASLEAVKKLCAFIKAKKFNVRPKVLSVFLHLPLSTVLPEGTDILTGHTPKKDRKHLSRTQRKKRKEEKEAAKEMKEAAAEIDKEEKKEVQTQTLKTIFLIYFRILKAEKKSPCIAEVLEGLSKFAHLTNIELLMDILELMKELIGPGSKLSITSKLHCVSCSFQTLNLQGDTLNVDLKAFYDNLYSILFEILSVSLSEDHKIMPIVITCFDRMFTLRKELVLDRLAAFIKRMMAMSLWLSPHVTVAILSVINRLIQNYPRTQALLENESIGKGVYQIELNDAEHCNPFSSVLWEFALLNRHPHPVLSHFASLVSKQSQITGQQHTPLQLYQFYSPNDDKVSISFSHLFLSSPFSSERKNASIWYTYPDIPEPIPGPLIKKYEKITKAKNKSVNRACFIRTSEYNSGFINQISSTVELGKKEEDVTMDLEDFFKDVTSLQVIK